MAGPSTLFQAGTHASRPATGAGCVLYACSDHGLIYLDSGSSWTTWADLSALAGGMTNPMTTAGDVIYGGASGTPTRLGVGTAGQVLKVNAGATAPEWGAAAGGGGFTFINEVTLGSAATNMEIASIPNTYRALMLVVRARTDRAAQGSDGIDLRMGATSVDTGANYDYMTRYDGSAASTSTDNAATYIKGPLVPGAAPTAGYWGISRWLIYDYADTTYWKTVEFTGGHTPAANQRSTHGNAQWRSTSAVDVIRIIPELGTNLITGSKMTLWGLAAS